MYRASRLSRYLSRAQHPRAEAVVNTIVAAPRRVDVVASVLELGSWTTFLVTYGIIFNWIYTSHLDLWDGTYGIEDDDDDDD